MSDAEQTHTNLDPAFVFWNLKTGADAVAFSSNAPLFDEIFESIVMLNV